MSPSLETHPSHTSCEGSYLQLRIPAADITAERISAELARAPVQASGAFSKVPNANTQHHEASRRQHPYHRPGRPETPSLPPVPGLRGIPAIERSLCDIHALTANTSSYLALRNECGDHNSRFGPESTNLRCPFSDHWPATPTTGEAMKERKTLIRWWIGVGVVAISGLIVFVSLILYWPSRTVREMPESQPVADASKLDFPSEISDFDFVDPTLAAFATQVDAIARREFAELHHGNYDDVKPQVRRDAIVARWCMHKDEKGDSIGWLRRQPNRGGSIHLDSRNVSGKIERVHVIGSCYSNDGWAVSMQHSTGEGGKFHINIFHERLIPKQSDGFTLNLVNPMLKHLQQSSSNHTIAFTTIVALGGELARPQDDVLVWLSSAEQLRDAALRQLDTLELIALKRIEAGEGMTITDWTHVRSDNPPISIPRETGPLPEDEERKFKQRASEIIDGRRSVIREHFQEIYAAVSDAFPFVNAFEDSLIRDAAE